MPTNIKLWQMSKMNRKITVLLTRTLRSKEEPNAKQDQSRTSQQLEARNQARWPRSLGNLSLRALMVWSDPLRSQHYSKIKAWKLDLVALSPAESPYNNHKQPRRTVWAHMSLTTRLRMSIVWASSPPSRRTLDSPACSLAWVSELRIRWISILSLIHISEPTRPY